MSLLHVWLYYILLPYWSITFTLFGLARLLPPKPAQLTLFGARSLCYIAGMTTCAIYGVIASIFLRCVGQAGLSQWTVARSFKWLMYPLIGIWFDVDEESRARLDSTRPAVFVANHQTELDILFLGHVWPKYTSVTAKSDLKWYPFLGQFSE
jgi:lysophosphatidate acyltransferase